jgi:hypothetical protein
MTIGQTDPEDLIAGASSVRLSFLEASSIARAA